MARQLSIEYEDAIYHVVNRGDRREEIFRDDVNPEIVFCTPWAAIVVKTSWQVHCLTKLGWRDENLRLDDIEQLRIKARAVGHLVAF
jgi:hypothetical protein